MNIEAIAEFEDPKRLEHTQRVCKEAERLAMIFDLSLKEKDDLYSAALLHDITKKLSKDEHIALAKKHGLMLNEEDLGSDAVLHQFTAPLLAKERFGELLTPEAAAAISCHTTAKADMTLVEKLLYLADYIEAGRKYYDCVYLRNRFYREISDKKDKLEVLDSVILSSLEITENHIKDKKGHIHSLTKQAKLSLLDAKKRRKNFMEENVQNMQTLSPLELARKIVSVLNDKNASQIKLLSVESKTELCDYFVICSGNSNTEIKSYSGEVEYKLETDCSIKPKNIEGYNEASWIVMDYGNVILHIFNRETRDFYKLEKLWEEGVNVDISDLLTEK